MGGGVKPLDFVIQGAAPPPPGAMDKGGMGRVHQPHYGMVDVAGEPHGVADGGLLGVVKAGNTGNIELGRFGPVAIAFRHINPHIPLHFFDVVPLHVKPAQVHVLLGHQGGNVDAPAVFVKSPAVVAALHVFAVVPAAAQGDRPVGTNIADGKGFALVGAAQQNGLVQQGFGHHFAPLQLSAGHGVIPDISQ